MDEPPGMGETMGVVNLLRAGKTSGVGEQGDPESG